VFFSTKYLAWYSFGMKKLMFLAGAIVILVAAGAVSYQRLSYRSPAQPEGLPEHTEASKQDDPQTPKLIIGRADAPITIIEYGDFQCPICKRFFEQTEPQLIREWIDTGKAKIEFRVETHIGTGSVIAGEAAYCANDQGKFKEYHDELYRRQGKAEFNLSLMKVIAGELNLDTAVFSSCLEGGKHRAVVEQSHRDAQKSISGTPTFFIGDQKIVGAQPYSIFKTILERQ
jgi:protein-disulfide isomerase